MSAVQSRPTPQNLGRNAGGFFYLKREYSNVTENPCVVPMNIGAHTTKPSRLFREGFLFPFFPHILFAHCYHQTNRLHITALWYLI